MFMKETKPILCRAENFKAIPAIANDNRFDCAKPHVLFHNCVFSITGSLLVNQLITLHAEPTSVPGLERVARALEQIPLHLQLVRQRVMQRHDVPIVHLDVPVFHFFFQSRSAVSHAHQFLAQFFYQRIQILTHVTALMIKSDTGLHVVD